MAVRTSRMPGDRVRLDELQQPVGAELAPHAAQAKATERRSVVLRDGVVVVDPRRAGSKAPRNVVGVLRVRTPDGGAQPRPVVVDGGDCGVLVVEGQDGQRGPELLLANNPQLRRRVEYERRQEEVSARALRFVVERAELPHLVPR